MTDTQPLTAVPREPLWRAVGDGAQLCAVRCGRCDALLFPPQRYGCPSCGGASEQLRDEAVAAAGTVEAVVIVQSGPSAGVVIGEVSLGADRPTIRARLAEPCERGSAVVGRARPAGDGPDELVFEVAR